MPEKLHVSKRKTSNNDKNENTYEWDHAKKWAQWDQKDFEIGVVMRPFMRYICRETIRMA